MNEENEIVFNKVCRICLKSYNKLYYLFETEAPSMLKFCGFLEVAQYDEFPDKICEICHDMLIQSYKLKQLCLSSKSYLQSVIDTEENLNLCNKNVGRSEQCEDDTTGNEEPYCSECQAHFASKDLFNQHNCINVLKDDQSVLSNNECALKNSPPQFEDDPDSTGVSNNEDDIKKLIYQCPHCKILFDHEQDVFVHLSIHSKDGPACNVCKKTFSTMKILKRHIKIHMIVKSHICKICDKGFPESAALFKHTRLYHLRLPRDKKYTCDECGQRFTDQYYLNLHRRKHTGEKPFKCEICKKAFYDPRSYKVHMDVHKGVKPYLCSHCGKSFVQSSHLKLHLLVHTKEKPHTCSICNKSFTQSASLLRHMKIHPDLVCCNVCTERFSSKKELLEHEENHNRKKIATVKKEK